VASIAEVKAAIDAAMQQVTDVQAAIRAASEQLTGAQQMLAAALEGTGHESVGAAQAALAQAAQELEECLNATLLATEQAQSYVAALG